jgi:Rod binding domain-containing protein
MKVGIPPEMLLPGAGLSSAPVRNEQKGVAAAKDFEALLIGQMLRSVRQEGSGWLGTGDDEAGSAAYSLGEDQLAKAMAAGGGFGLSKVIAAGLAPQPVTPAAGTKLKR